MSKKLNFRTENIDFKKLLQKREEKQKQQALNRNPFLLTVPKTDKALYKSLYKFDPKAELEDYRLPLGSDPAELEGSEKVKTTQRKNTESPDDKGKRNPEEIDEGDMQLNEQEEEIEENKMQEENQEKKQFLYKSNAINLFNEKNEKNKNQGNKIQNALFIDASVKEQLAKIKTGEDAISFFAKYGNSTPIKFIHCLLEEKMPEYKPSPDKLFRPYDLKVIHAGDNQKELTHDDYYTISAHGIVHVYTERSKKKTDGDSSTEVVSLSDWMHESTMFNIITNIHFFKNYCITKIFNIWKANVRYRIFCKTRKKLVRDSFIAKPAFANHLMEMNKQIFEIQTMKTISNNLVTQNKTWELETDFKSDQKRARAEALRHYEVIIEKVVAMVENLCKEVSERTNIKEASEVEEARFGKQIRQKPMNQIRKDKEEREYRLELAKKDKGKLKGFIRLIGHIIIETLIKTTIMSLKILLDEMKKENRRKEGLFNSSVLFDDNQMSFNPNKKDISDALGTILEEVVKVVKDSSNALIHNSPEQYKKIAENVNFPDIQDIILNMREFERIEFEIHEKVDNDFGNAQKFVDDRYAKCRIIYEDKNIWKQAEFEKEEHTLEDLKTSIKKLNEWESIIKINITEAVKGIVYIDGKKIRNMLQPHVAERLEFFKNYMYNLMKKKSNITFNELQDFLESFEKKPTTLPEFAKYVERLNTSLEKLKTLESDKQDIELMHAQLRKFPNQPLKYTDTNQLEEILKKFNELISKQKEADAIKTEKKSDMMSKLDKEMLDLQKNINEASVKVNSGKLSLEDLPATESNKDLNIALKEVNIVRGTLKEISKLIDRYKERDKNYTHYQTLMELKPQPNQALMELEAKFNDRKLLWNNIEAFAKNHEEWYKNPFSPFDVEKFETNMKTYEKSVIHLKQNITNLSKDGKDKVLEMFISELRHVTTVQPIIIALGNKDMTTKHWKQVYELLTPNWQPPKTVNLTELISNGVLDRRKEIEEISERATGEFQILSNLEGIKKKWAELAFIVNPYREYKDKFTLGTLEDVITTLDDHQVLIQTMLGSPSVIAIRTEVEEWEKRLVLISEIIDEWVSCQKQWMYLENIFSSDDIQKQLPQETSKFLQVDKFWKDIMQKTFKRPIVQECCNSEELLKKFILNNKSLEDIQKQLENYLETKRLAFPRFYFLSNDELLEILSQTRNPLAVQPHLRKCFDNINRIHFTNVQNSREIIAMQSAEPETMPEVVPFSNSVIILPEDKVEQWLMKIQEMMVTSLYEVTREAYKNYPDGVPDRKSWLFAYPAQPVLTVDLVKWTMEAEKAIFKLQKGGAGKNALQEYYDFMKEIMNKMTVIVRGQLNTLERTLMGCLIVIEVHARDVIGNMIDLKVNSINDFEWQKQLRYYWSSEIDNCEVKQTNANFLYGYEYLGNGPRLVITPLTDKCYMTLTGALRLNFGGNPQGPAGTGKTETTKDLAKALAIQCVVFNCSDSLDYKTMGRFFSGLAQCGAWSCFDEFNRIDIEVLSVIAQQILTIQQAIRALFEQFEFEGRLIPLNPRFGVFITMNPGYAGRTELPDNLKSLFRPVSMMIPDYALIAEIILFSEGFDTARELANKMVQLYKLSSEQLSKQHHYDFGMRAVKSVLVMAGSLRRSDPNTPEDIVLIRAMRDSNVPKFLAHDLPLFMGIIQDLFPKVEIREISYPELERAITNQLEEEKLQKPPMFMTKILQLMETIRVRHGVMLVGETGSGKSKCASILSKALIQLKKEKIEDYYYKNVITYKLNPKSVTMNELFGYVNVMTNEWADGIVAKIIREAVQDTSDDKKWVFFDGPVDALWIENMNTVLDDNKMLCLSNGQRIKLPATFTMMFEVQDLAVASPATVSRCGMVYMEPIHLGWEPIIETWAYYFREKERDKEKGTVPNYINNLIEKIRTIFKENFKFLREECKEVIPTVDSNLVKSCLNLTQVMFDDFKTYCSEQDAPPTTQAELDNYMSQIMYFAFIWSAGGNLQDNPKDNSRAKFSQTIKTKMMKQFYLEGDVYDYYPEFAKKEFRLWSDMEKLKEWKYDPSLPYFNILVPTSDTIKFRFMLEKLVRSGHNILFNGETGTGKSVIVQEYLLNLNQDQYSFSTMNFSAQTSSKNLLDLFMDKDKFIKKKRDLIGPPAGKKMVFFIDDINMPQPEKYGAQPPIELLRQIIDHGGFYDLKKLDFIYVKDCIFVSACAKPGGGRNQVTPRLFRHFNMFWIPELSQKSMEKIFTSILSGYLSQKEKIDLAKYSSHIVKSSIEIYFKITKDLLPTPSKSHYTFNLRDLSKVFQGVLQMKLNHLESKESLLQLWIHESSRVFHDRLVDEKDRDWFNTQILDQLKKNLDYEPPKDEFSQYIYGDYVNNIKDYVKIENMADVDNKFTDNLVLYNLNFPKNMNLVFFKDAISHLSRICRVLRQQRGNALLIGVGGSGRGSLTRLATFMRGYTCFSIEIAKNYKEPQWKDDLKKLLKTAGAKNNQVVFLFSDTQIAKESFLEDINNILNTGEVPNLMAPEDWEEIITDVRPLAKEAGKFDSRDIIVKHFISLVRENLHIVLAFSPVGNKLRDRCRQFPSIINCCTIDWYDRWPDEALFSVAEREYTSQEHLGIGEFKGALSKLSVEIHTDVINISNNFYEELRRRNYTTPTSYLELLKLYIDMLKVQQDKLPKEIRKYKVGLETLSATNVEVGRLQQKIVEFQPILEQSAKENEVLLIELEGKTKIANETEAVCSKEAAEAQQQRDEVNTLKDSCQRELDEALPILEAAKEAVRQIDKDKITEMKAMPKPPELVGIVMKAVCCLFGEKEEWDNAKRLLGKMTFLNDLIAFDVEQVPEKRFFKLREVYFKQEKFKKDEIKNVSIAAMSIFIWLEAIDKFQKVKKVVTPKEKALKEAEESLRVVEGKLASKMNALKEVQDNVSELKRNLENSQKRAESLKQQQETAKVQLRRAEKLLSGLGSESERWKINVAQLEEDLKNLTGNIILAAATIAYLGPFTSDFREKMVAKWINRCKELKIPISSSFSVTRILSDDIMIREWQDCGLPADNLSTENGILIFNAGRWPLIIDPQNQANKFIKRFQKDNKLQVMKLTDGNFLKILEGCISSGQPAMIENVEEVLDPSLEPILTKQIVKKGAQSTLKLGDTEVRYNQNFRLYFTTKLPNPHYLPEVCIKVTLINFTVTPSGLEDQLLIEVVRFERIELEEKRINLILTISQDKKLLQDLENKILRQILEVQNRILEDEGLITMLDTSKVTSDTINQRMKQSELTRKEIDAARESYRVIAKRGSIIYFVIASLALIDPMYQYSLEFFIKLFKKRLEKSENPPVLEQRLKILIDDITDSFYKNICRGLFEKDKLLFSFLLATNIDIGAGKIDPKLWNIFLRGYTGDVIEEANPYPNVVEDVWRNILGLATISSTFKNLVQSMTNENDKVIWDKIFEAPDPQEVELPMIFRNLTMFQKLLLMKTLREEKLISFIHQYVKTSLGPQFIESPLFDLKGPFTDSSSTTPLVFILSPGADPISYLTDLAKEKDMEQRLKMLSLGQGQGEIAAEWIKAGRRTGDWVCLQNCHLAVSWLGTLERIQESQVEADTHPDYRIWLTSMPTPKFPVPILQNSIKITNEPPKGLKANLKRTYNEVKEKDYDSSLKPKEYKKLLFSLAFFHAVILERRKFGAIGWNIPYEWMGSDFETCQLQLKINLDEQPEVPYKALNVLIAEINYGGRVTDDKDIRAIKALLESYFNPGVMNDYKFSSSGIYFSPQKLVLGEVRDYINSLPLEDDPEVFGLHQNANITFQQKIVREFMGTLLEVSPRTANDKAAGDSPDDVVFKLAAEIEKKIRDKFKIKRPEQMKSLDIFRIQELERYNALIDSMKRSLVNLQKAIRGLEVMSMELEMMFNSFFNQRVPENWNKVSYLSLKPLGSWVADLVKRLEFYTHWDEKGHMDSYWVSSFFFPQGFMTAVLQTFARKNEIPIDTLIFKATVRKYFKDHIEEVPDDGVNIHGLFLQGCKWNMTSQILDESEEKVLFIEMPVIWLEPIQKHELKSTNQYACPLYKTSSRAGELSTTGHSTNFVLYINLDTKQQPDHWVRRGAALLCQLDS